MSESIDILLKWIVYSAEMLTLCISSILFVRYVLHWKIRKIRSSAALSSVISLIGAAGMTATTVWAQRNQDPETIAFIDELILPLFFLLVWIILLVRTEGRVWKRAIVSWIAIGIVAAITTRFTYLPDYIGIHLDPLPSALLHLSASALVLLFVWFLTRISKKSIDRPIRVGTVFLLGMLLLLFEEVVLSEIEVITTPSISLSLDTAVNRPFYIGLDIVLYLTALILALVLFAQKSENTYYKEMIEANDQYLKAQAQYYEALERSDTEIRKIRHDMKNNLTVLSLLLENGDYPQMKSYLAELDASVQAADTGIRNGNRIADAILFDKKQKAEKAGCTLSIDGTFTYTGMSAVDICAILGNLLDNAIEATAPLPLEKRGITLRFARTDHYFTISQANPCAKQSLIDGSSRTTSKSDKQNHGFGLLNLKEALARYQGEMKNTCEPSSDEFCEFRTEIIIPLE